MNRLPAKCKREFDRQINKQVFCNERERVAERLSSEWGAHNLWSHRQLDKDSRPALCESPPLRNKWGMKWRRPDSTGSTDRTLPALICGFWWVLAVTPGHNFHSAMGSQTASHRPNHQNPHTLFSRASLLSLGFAWKFLSSQTLLRLGNSNGLLQRWQFITIAIEHNISPNLVINHLKSVKSLSPVYSTLLTEGTAGVQVLGGHPNNIF